MLRAIVSPRFDLLWFFGGAIASLLMLGLHFGAGVSIVALWWLWLLGFDGPHIAAAFTRTYVDSDEWKNRRGLLVGSLVLSFALGPACLLLNWVTGTEEPFLFFLGAATFYGYYHVVRQHYGFLALYKTKSQDREDFRLDKWFLYVGCWLPYFWFLLAHPKARALLKLAPRMTDLEALAANVLLGAWIVLVVAYFAQALIRRRAGTKLLYLGVTVPLYGIVYFAIGRLEPVFKESAGPDQDFLLLSILITIFHNVQYVGLIWFHNRNRYGPDRAPLGPATELNRHLGGYLAACLGFSLVVYFGLAALASVFPWFSVFTKDARVGPFLGSQIGLAFWWGLAIHHYVLDQRIWRIGGDPALKRNLGLVT